MLDLSYRPDIQSVYVVFTGENRLWADIRSSFDDSSQEVRTISGSSLILPLWAFLSCRKALVYAIRKYQVALHVDEAMAFHLQKAIESEKTYHEAILASPLAQDHILAELKERGFIRELTREQLRNVLSLCRLPAGATFSVPGAGKTTEAIAYYLLKKAPPSRLLVVCPKNAFTVWEEQLSLCINPTPKSVRLTGGEKAIVQAIESDPEVMLIGYQQLSNVRGIIASHIAAHPTLMFLDESHHIKRGAQGLWGATVLSLAHLPQAKLIMSGTPLPNSISDLQPQFTFLYPEIDPSEQDAVSLIQPVFVRTTKAELHLPDITTVYTPIRLRERQWELYQLLRSEESRKISSLSVRDKSYMRNLGRSVFRLIQVASNPALLLTADIILPDWFSDVLLEGDSPKIEYACFKARALAHEGKKVVIWSTFVRNVEVIAERLSDIGADFIHGGVETGSEDEDQTREFKIRRFHDDPGAFVLVANPAACSEAISLHSVCHHAIYIDRNYNVAQFLQSQDRIHRLGLPPETKTTIEILLSPRTIDESVSRRLTAKTARMAEVLNDPSLEVEPFVPDFETEELDPDDIADLLKHITAT
jgi:SNF2 family DNA or RNA helicase